MADRYGKVGTAWFMGARFDGLSDKLSPAKVLSSLNAPAPTPVGHNEL